MANNQNANQSNMARAPKKLLLGEIYTDAPVRVEPEEPQKILVAGLAEARPKKDYPDTFFGRAFKVYRGEFILMLKSSIFFILSTLPFIILMAWFAGFYERLVLGNSFNFMGDIGGGYPGGGDSLTLSVARQLWEVKMPVIGMLAAALVFGGIFFSGAFYCAKRSFYQDYYSKSVKTYWLGFVKYWWVFLLMSVIGVGIGLAISASTVHLLYLQTLGTAGAGDYCAVVFSFIIGVPLMLICMVMLSIYVVYKVNLWQAFKNSLTVICNSPIMVFFVGAFSAAPLALCIVGGIFQIIVYILMAALGSNLLALCWVAMAGRGMQKCHVRKLDHDKLVAQQQRQEARRAMKAEPRKDKQKQQPKPYQNPKKKKKK